MSDDFTPIERRLLTRIQCNFPLCEDPYGVLAEELGASRGDILAATRSLRAGGVIRRLGGSFVPRRLGYVSVLVAGCVAPDRLEATAALAASFPEVTHNYERKDRFNLWFTVIAENQSRLTHILDTVRACDGVHGLHALPALKTFKIRVNFDLDGTESGGNAPGKKAAPHTKATSPLAKTEAEPAPYAVDDLDSRIIPRCCGDIGDSERPFADLARELGIPVGTLLDRLVAYRDAGVLRRFGAILRHQAAGFVANGMSVWNVPDGEVDRVGRLMAEFPEISHCYERPRFEGWPYNTFGMIHGTSKEACFEVARRVSEITGIRDYRVLFSLREFKKTSMVYGIPTERI